MCTHIDRVPRHSDLNQNGFWFLLRPSCGQLYFAVKEAVKAPLILLRKFGKLTAGFMAADLTQTLFSIKRVCFYSLNFSRSQARAAANSIQRWVVNGVSSRSCEIVCSRKKRPHRLRTHGEDTTQQIQSSSSSQHGLIRAWFTNGASVCHYQFYSCSLCFVMSEVLFHVRAAAVEQQIALTHAVLVISLIRLTWRSGAIVLSLVLSALAIDRLQH